MVNLYHDYSSCHDLSKNVAARGRSFFFPISLNNLHSKIFLSETTRPISILLGRNVSYVTFYQYCSTYHDLSKKKSKQNTWLLAVGGGGGGNLFSLYIYSENFKNLLVRNHWTDFNITWQKCFFANPLPSLIKLFWFVKKHSCKGRGLFSLYMYIKMFINLLVRNHWTNFHIALLDMFSLVTLYQDSVQILMMH